MTNYLKSVKANSFVSDASARSVIACPVDVSVYNGDTLVGRVKNNQVLESVTTIPMFVYDDAKFMLVPNDGSHRIEITATDSGTMNYSIEDFNTETGGSTKIFENVALYNGKEMLSEIDGTPDITLKIIKDGKVIGEIYENGSETLYRSAPTFTRHAGATRHETAAKASRAAFPLGAQAAIVASAGNYPDALSASTLAGVKNAPILLSPTTALDNDTRTELNRLKPAVIYIVGGTGAVSETVERQLKALTFLPSVKRLGGANRFATGKLIADEALGKNTQVAEIYLANGDNFPDALAVASFSVIKHIPVLLTDHTKISPEVTAFINEDKVAKVTIIGGTSSVSQSAENHLRNSLHLNVVRLAGGDRYETAHKVTSTLMNEYGLKPQLIGVATGDKFPDALSGGASLGARGGVLVLTPIKTLHPQTKAHLQAHVNNKPSIEILGGDTAISALVEREIRGMFGV